MHEESFSWEAYEFERREKSVDWFWALGIIAICAIVISILYKNYLFAIFIAIGAMTIGKLANQEPRLLKYEISPAGVRVEDELYPLDKLKGYAIREIKKGNQKILIVETSKSVAPIITIPIENEMIPEIKKYLEPKVSEKDLHEPTAHQIMDAIGF